MAKISSGIHQAETDVLRTQSIQEEISREIFNRLEVIFMLRSEQ